MHAKRYRKEFGGFDESARERLMAHPFPGNVRELDHVIERAVLMSTGPQIKARDLGLSTGGGDARGLEEMSLEEVEAYLIKKALARAGGNARQAAEALGLSRSAFYRRLQQWTVSVIAEALRRARLRSGCRRHASHHSGSASESTNRRRSPKSRRRTSYEDRLTWLTIGAAAPATLIALCFALVRGYSAKVQWTLTLVIAGFAFGYIVSMREQLHPSLADSDELARGLARGRLLDPGPGARANDALGEALLEVNELGETLRLQRLGAFEATRTFTHDHGRDRCRRLHLRSGTQATSC